MLLDSYRRKCRVSVKISAMFNFDFQSSLDYDLQGEMQ